jgi:hypothetical protein
MIGMLIPAKHHGPQFLGTVRGVFGGQQLPELALTGPISGEDATAWGCGVAPESGKAAEAVEGRHCNAIQLIASSKYAATAFCRIVESCPAAIGAAPASSLCPRCLPIARPES